MKDKKNDQTIQSNPTDLQNKGNNGTLTNPKKEGNTPEKTSPEKRENGNGNEPLGSKNTSTTQTPKSEQKRNDNTPDPKKNGNTSDKTPSHVENNEDEQIGDDEELEENAPSEKRKTPVSEKDSDTVTGE